jgi:two-component system chemotaxis response regulator CheY
MSLRILVVDDSDYMRQMLVMMLKKLSVQDIVQAGSGAEALQILLKSEMDLVLLDCVMPKEDGFQVLKAIRANPNIAKLPVILVTGHADGEIVAKARTPETRADGIIAKPLSLATLEAKIRSVLTAHGKLR